MKCEVGKRGQGYLSPVGCFVSTNICVVQLNIVHPCTLMNHGASWAESSAHFHIFKIFSHISAWSVGSWDPCPPSCHIFLLGPRVGAEWEHCPSVKHPTSFWHWESNSHAELCWQCNIVSCFTSAVACAIYIVCLAATRGMMNGLCVPCFLLPLISDW